MQKKILIMIYFISYNISQGYYFDDDEATVSIDEEEYAKPVPCAGYCEHIPREKRVADSTVKSRIIDVMMRTPQLHLNPSEPDILSFLIDKYELPKGFKGPLSEYDFIVVGAGSAGSVLASRLSEGRQASVLLLEAGHGESLFTEVPILAPVFQQSEYTWQYLMEHQPGVCVDSNQEYLKSSKAELMQSSSNVYNYAHDSSEHDNENDGYVSQKDIHNPYSESFSPDDTAEVKDYSEDDKDDENLNVIPKDEEYDDNDDDDNNNEEEPSDDQVEQSEVFDEEDDPNFNNEYNDKSADYEDSEELDQTFNDEEVHGEKYKDTNNNNYIENDESSAVPY